YLCFLLQRTVASERQLSFPTRRSSDLVGKVNDWGAVHHCYHRLSNEYPTHKLAHALASLLEINGMQRGELTREFIQKIVDESIQTKQWICEEIHKTRAKDYQNRFRQMVYENEAERDAVVGSLA